MNSTDPDSEALGQLINIFLWAAFGLLIFKMVRSLLPLRVNAEATGFEGIRKQNWQVTRVTGRVLWSSSSTETRISTGYHADGSPFVRSRTYFREAIRMQLMDGRVSDFQVVNFRVNPGPGDIITLCYAQRGRRWGTIAVLNHTTNLQFTDEASLFNLLEPHAGTYAVIGILLMSVICVFTACFLLIPGMALVFFYYKRKGTVLRNFGQSGPNSGIVALWVHSAAEAAALASSP